MSEETELIRVGLQGGDMFLRLAGTGMKEGLKFLKGILMFMPNAFRWWQGTAEMYLKKEMTKKEYAIIRARQEIASGSMNSEEFMKVFSAEERVILNIPDASAERFKKLAEKNGLTYTLLADLNPEDGFFQIMVPKSQSDIYELIIEKMTAEELNEIEAMKGYLKNEIDTLKKQRVEIKRDLNKMKEEGKADTEEYNEKEKELNICSEKINNFNFELMNADKMHSGEMTSEEYMKTNEFAFNHADLFTEMMDAGIVAESKSIFTIMEYKHTETGSSPVTKDLEAALTEVTEKKELLDTDKKIVICSADNPDTYIEAYSFTRERDDKTYICTQYDLYVEGKKQTCDEFAHGEFTHYSDSKAVNSSDAGNQHWDNMKKEIKEKGGFGQVAVFNSVSEYREYVDKVNNGSECTYIVNPNLSGMAIRKEKTSGEQADKYTLVRNGQDTSISFNIDGNTEKGLVVSYTKQIEIQAKQVNPNANLHAEWLELSEGNYEKWLEITETGKTPSEGNIDKEQEDISRKKLNEEFEDIMPEEVQEKVKEEGRAEAERSKVIIEIPPENTFIFDKNSRNPDIFVFADDTSCRAVLPFSKVKTTGEGKKLLLLEVNESIPILDRSDREIGKITDRQSFDNFIKGSESIKSSPVKSQHLERKGEIGGAKIQ